MIVGVAGMRGTARARLLRTLDYLSGIVPQIYRFVKMDLRCEVLVESIERTWGAAVLRPYMTEDTRRVVAVELGCGFVLGFEGSQFC